MKKRLQYLVCAVCVAIVVCLSSLAFAMAGDTNADGRVNSRDIAVIQKHLIQIQYIEPSNFSTADFNGDGKINSRDISKLQKYIIKIENTVGPLPTATPIPTPDFTLN